MHRKLHLMLAAHGFERGILKLSCKLANADCVSESSCFSIKDKPPASSAMPDFIVLHLYICVKVDERCTGDLGKNVREVGSNATV